MLTKMTGLKKGSFMNDQQWYYLTSLLRVFFSNDIEMLQMTLLAEANRDEKTIKELAHSVIMYIKDCINESYDEEDN